MSAHGTKTTIEAEIHEYRAGESHTVSREDIVRRKAEWDLDFKLRSERVPTRGGNSYIITRATHAGMRAGRLQSQPRPVTSMRTVCEHATAPTLLGRACLSIHSE